jgi:glyoxylase-like metal-dependent hydrolase (beta-lactamase superfamily II)
MVHVSKHGPVTGLRFSWLRSSTAGYAVHAFILRGVLVDTAFPGAAPALARVLDERAPGTAHPIEGAMITHAHEDHAGNVQLLAERGVPIAAAPGTLAYARAPERIALYRRIVWGSAPPLTAPIVPFEHDVLQLVATPGHSADHHIVWDPEHEIVIAGDLFLGVKVRVAHADEDPVALVCSLRAIADLRPRRLFDAHRGHVDRPEQALRAKADWLEQTIGNIRHLHGVGWSRRAIRRELLGRHGFAHYASAGEYSEDNLVRAALSSDPARAH